MASKNIKLFLYHKERLEDLSPPLRLHDEMIVCRTLALMFNLRWKIQKNVYIVTIQKNLISRLKHVKLQKVFQQNLFSTASFLIFVEAKIGFQPSFLMFVGSQNLFSTSSFLIFVGRQHLFSTASFLVFVRSRLKNTILAWDGIRSGTPVLFIYFQKPLAFIFNKVIFKICTVAIFRKNLYSSTFIFKHHYQK